MIGRIIDFFLGKNGYDHEKNEQTIRRLKDESIQCMDRAKENFEETKYAFESLDLGDEVPEPPSKGPLCPDPRDL
jgi:hypothetical protein